MSGDDNLWYVKTTDGDVHRVTLDQLDEAFQAGRIDGKVMVLGGGATAWTTLSQLAGLDEPAPPPPARPSPQAFLPSSLRPVSLDLSLDLDENVFRKKSRKGVVFGGLVAILAVFGGIMAVNRGHIGSYNLAGSLASLTAAPAVAAPPPAPVDPPPPEVATPAPAAAPASLPTTAASAAPSVDPNAAKLSDEQRAKLAAADKALELKTKGHKKGHAAGGAPSHGSSKAKSQGFTTGGNKFDPLNASF